MTSRNAYGIQHAISSWHTYYPIAYVIKHSGFDPRNARNRITSYKVANSGFAGYNEIKYN